MKNSENCDIGLLKSNYVPIEFYIAVRYRHIFAIRGTHAWNIGLVSFYTKPMFCVLFLEQRAEIGTTTRSWGHLRSTRTQPPLYVCPYSLHRGAMDNKAVAATMAIPTAVGWTGATSCSCWARAKGVARFQQQRGHSTAAAVNCAAAQQSVGSPVLLLYPRINFLVCLRSSSQPSSYQNPCPQPKATPKDDDPALFVRSSHCRTRRSPRPCRVCTSLLLTAGATILLLSREIGLAANNILFIPSSIRTTPDASGKYAI